MRLLIIASDELTMINAWTIYFLASLLFTGFGVWLLIRMLSGRIARRYIIATAIALLAILLTPVGVPDTEQLAPAWLVVFYELAFGSQDMVQRALQPLLWATLVITPIIVAAFIGQSLLSRKYQSRKN